MARLKTDNVKWTVALVLVVFSPIVYSRPQVEVPSTTLSVASIPTNNSTETTIRVTSESLSNENKKDDATPALSNTSREVKVKSPAIGESIKKVTIQLLDKPNKTIEAAVVPDTRIPPKIKSQVTQKQKHKTRKEDEQSIENSHVGIAVPVTMEELELENKELVHESSTNSEGLSTWILLSNPPNKENTSIATEPTKTEDVQKKQKPVLNKNKNKKPQNKIPGAKRPIIGSTNKSDLVAGGSAINENIYNKIKDTVLSNVQKNKNITPRSTTLSSTSVTPSTEALTTKALVPTAKVTSKPAKKSNKNKQKTSTTTTTTYLPIISESAMLPMEPKEQEIELEVSTPATTTKKPKRSSTRKKTKTKKRKTSKPKPEASTAASTDVKTSNKTKPTKTSKKPTSIASPLTSQIYNYFSREVMPSVGVGVIGLAGLVGLASYFLYPFATPVRRTIEVDKKDDIYRHNAEEYGSEGNGQPEEEMLGTVLAGMPIHSKQKLNPYVSQTAYVNRYPTKKDQDLRYRHVVTPSYPNHSVHYPQQKTGIAHGAVYPDPYNNYNRYQYETRHAYTTAEKKNDKTQTYSPYQVAAVEPIYAAPQAGSPEISSYGSDLSSSVVYGVKPAEETDFKPVYPYDSQFYSETTSSSVTYSPTSMYLGSNNEAEETESDNYADDNSEDTETSDNKFVVGNVPKELTESATPAVVPEHGPRKLERRRRNMRRKRNVVGSIEEILKATREKNEIFLSNEIDDGLEVPAKTPSPIESMQVKNEVTITPENKDVFTVYAVSVDPAKEFTQTEEASTIKNDVIESVSTLPVDEKKVTETEISNDVDATTKTFKVYEVFTSKPEIITEKSTTIDENSNTKADLTTQIKNMNTETTTDIRSETTSTLLPSPPPVSVITSRRPYRPTYYGPTYKPEVITYPPLPSSGGGFFDFLKRVVDFKFRLGMSILQNTSESLNRYLRSMEESVKRAAKA
ncbi:cell wall protein DAN4-like [Maniola jurtina]|uniref:cell wall protein DAN4-like n=1 Tax=Maniola jurtina TaxID=191418 RepID=UPI001E688F8D|nr:cell wall protein DAN4-like [Maniola jurtina]XP_045773868.1 cell wall protein DAN4-like [Maniola jurtina]